MIRDLARLSRGPYDLVVVGGGIYGACAAWEGTLRGLSVALVEQGDFGHATSANSQKIIHGGLRYLQSLDLRRMRASIRERRTLLHIAPHLVRPMPCLMPTYGYGQRSKTVMRLALLINDLVSWDRNCGLDDPGGRIAPCRIISREACLQLAPGIVKQGLTGGALWSDGQIYNSERLTLAFIRSAHQSGATIANYVQVAGFIREGNRVIGVTAEDSVSGRAVTIGARVVLNTCGPWVQRLLHALDGSAPRRPVRFVKAMNVVTRCLHPTVALGVEDHRGRGRAPRLLFMTPWRNRSVIGTAYRASDGDPEQCQVSDEEIQHFIDEVNVAYPAAQLTRRDVRFVHRGLLPAATAHGTALATHDQVLDHRRVDGIEGLISTIGVKYTTAREVAEQAVELACRKLGRWAVPRGVSRTTPLDGGAMGCLDTFLQHAVRQRPMALSEPVISHLVYSYGAGYADVVRLVREQPAWGERVGGVEPIIKAEVIYAVRHEMALTLSDIVFRRTGLGAAGHPGEAALRTCAELMAQELGWDLIRTERELEQTRAVLARHGARSLEPREVLTS